MFALTRRRRVLDIWPGFVDGLAAMLMVVIFVLLLFSVGEFMLTDALMGRDKALDRLRTDIAALTDVLALERSEKAGLQDRLAQLSGELQATLRSRDDLTAQLERMTAQEQAARAAIASTEKTLQDERQRLQGALAASQQDTARQRELTEQAEIKVADLTRQMLALREQLTQLNQVLETSESKVKEQSVEIEDLGRRLNVALANKVEELSRYRSEFFGKLREALADNPDIRIEGDRFLLPSEVLFASASADLDSRGREQVETVARTLQEISAQIPDDIDWVLRVDGHTDKRPVRTAFPSNWELSSARAISIVKYMIELGVPAQRLVAAGFGKHHPIETGDSDEAYRQNRRIELKLSSR